MQIKNKYFLNLFTFFLLLTGPAHAYEGVVIVLEAPLLKSPDINSTVLQTIRKGKRVFVPNEVVVDGSVPEYIPTFDRAGNRAYIPGRFVKVITGTVAENKQPITLPYHDPTDYRLEEPIPASYPFDDRPFLRASLSFMIGNSTQSPYAYNSSFNKQNYPSELGTRISVTKKVTHDRYDRFYFGFIGFITNSKNTIEFKNNNLADESRGLLRLGPWLTYDSFKNDKYRLTLGTGFTFNYHRTTLFVDSGLTSEQRIFSSYSIAPMMSSNFQITDILPYTDFVAGLDLSLFLPHTQKDVEEPQIPELWSGSNQIDSSLKVQAALFVGAQFKY